MRPRGRYGEIGRALCTAARELYPQHGAVPVRRLAEHAQVGYSAAWYTASRLVDRGDLVVLHPGRPALVGPAEAAAVAPEQRQLAALDELQRSFWDRL